MPLASFCFYAFLVSIGLCLVFAVFALISMDIQSTHLSVSLDYLTLGKYGYYGSDISLLRANSWKMIAKIMGNMSIFFGVMALILLLVAGAVSKLFVLLFS